MRDLGKRILTGRQVLSTVVYEQIPVDIPVGDNVRLRGILVKPAHQQKCKGQAIVMVHGFAAEKTENGLFTGALERFIGQNHWVLLYDWRGLGDSGGSFADSDLHMHAKDFLRVVTWLKDTVHLANHRIVAVGFSLGATIIGLAIEAGLKIGGIALLSPSLRPKKEMYPRYATEHIQRELRAQGFFRKGNVCVGGHFLESLQNTEISGLTLRKCRMPILILHGTEDARIPYMGTRAMSRDQRLGKNLTFLAFRGASHSFRPEDTHRPRVYATICKWIDSWSESAV